MADNETPRAESDDERGKRLDALSTWAEFATPTDPKE